MPPNKLERPWVRRALITDLAHSGKSQETLAAKYGVVQSSVSDFAARHRAEIEQVREEKENEFAGLLIAEKANRLAAYTEMLERALAQTPKTNGKGEIVYGLPDEDGNRHPIMEIDAGVAAKILRNVAEELGHLPNRVTLGGEVGIQTNYTIDGLDPGSLK